MGNMDTKKKEPANLTTREASQELGVTTMTITRWIQEGYLKAWKMNPLNKKSHWRIPTAEVDKLKSLRE